jgi:hypothetical protein
MRATVRQSRGRNPASRFTGRQVIGEQIVAHRNTAYWPERYTPLALLAKAAQWRQRAKGHLDAAAHTAALQHLEKNAVRVQAQAAANPTAMNLNAAGSLGNLVADGAARLAEDLAALEESCAEPPAFAIVYREPPVAGVPDNWVAEVYTICGHERTPALRTFSSAKPELAQTREQAVAALRELARHPQIQSLARGRDYHAARMRAAVRCALDTEPAEVRIRLAGEQRPEDWEEPR